MKKIKIILSIMLSLILLVGCGSDKTQVFEKEKHSLNTAEKISETNTTGTVDPNKTDQTQNSESKKTNQKSSVVGESKVKASTSDNHQNTKNNSVSVGVAQKTSGVTTQRSTQRTTTAATTQSTTTAAPQPETIRVSLSVDCINAFNAGNEIAQAISNNGYIYGPAVLEVAENTSVLDLLYASGLTVSTTQSSFGTYIVAIQSLAEFGVDGQGGWVYFVNGTMPNMASNKYILQPGDTVEFRYTVKNGDV